MSLVTVPIYLDATGITAVTVTATQLTTQLAAHPRIDEGSLMDTSAWSVTHIRTGYITADFEHWDPLPTPPDLEALRLYAEWLERHIDLDTHDRHLLAARIEAVADMDFCAVIDFYKDHINDWTDPADCRCGAPHAHPAGHLCSRCRRIGATGTRNPNLTQDDLVASLCDPQSSAGLSIAERLRGSTGLDAPWTNLEPQSITDTTGR
ncbi:hypothetical protein P5V93_24275 [Mycobacteroides abscessus subsp. abscessus]|nr:hypothetical protein [Mycobacteroides abscessus]MDO3101036.1 hypothetical protein [Mycobacteroides abscessus subsp. abscessus]MDO3184998.1 hypothetical protein [Mycobacteroides abscessus subsp. abscessus]MDO3194379.1 hypothetical protein [Mycobacteroides abscessus subsp. abscessus]MDO3287629.1 hypothetical protein [Mycobacteroides abscessus subsp. abscessus]OLT84721.1 hypothetical protein BKG58_15775 [Mycobacteroides abscessus subsp. abscessus]